MIRTQNKLFCFIKNSFWINIKKFTSMTSEDLSRISFIENEREDPIEMFSDLIKAYKTTNPNKPYIPMNIATIDDELGVLNRTVTYRDLEDGHIVFATEKNSIKYANIIKDPRVSITFLFDKIEWKGINSTWQVCLVGKAAELSPSQISNLWNAEPIYAKIRSQINECGKPVKFVEHKNAHDKLLNAYESGKDPLLQTKTYTAFKIVPIIWDFYKSGRNCIADRIQYRKEQIGDEKWCTMHVYS